MTPTIRAATASEMAYVRATWSKAAYGISRDKPALYTLFRPLFEGVMSRLLKRSVVRVAANPEDDEQILGCVVYRPAPDPALHLVSIKPEFRGFGIASLLCKEVGISFDRPTVHTLPIPMRLIRKQSKSARAARKAWTFVPYGLMP